VTTAADFEAAVVSRAAAVVAAILVLVSGGVAALGLFQICGLGLLAALAASIASVAGHPGRSVRWIGPAVIVVAMVTVIVAGFLAG
jgi:hypothetical protein